MNNWEKYFGNPEKTANTLENILNKRVNICKDFCKFAEEDCNSELLSDYDCCDAIKCFLEEEVNENHQ